MKRSLPSFQYWVCIILFSALNFQLSAQSPVITAVKPASGPVGTLLTISGSNLNNQPKVQIGGVNAVILSAGSNQLVAMVMPGATKGNISVATAGGTAKSSAVFAVTVPKPINIQQGSKLAGSNILNGQYGASFGKSVAISADGNTAITGAPSDNNETGAAWVFTRNSAGAWQQQGDKLVGKDSAGAVGNNQGYVAISADGNTAVSAGSFDTRHGGVIWIFTRSNGIWAQKDSIIRSGGDGGVVALSADGNTLAFGDTYYPSGLGTGRVVVYQRGANGHWAKQGDNLISYSVYHASQGIALALSADGNTLAVGASGDANQAGAVLIYTRTNGVWQQQGGKLTGKDAVYGLVGSYQGSSVALSADGNTLIFGGPEDDTFNGASWVFVRDTASGTWAQQGSKLYASGGSTYSNQGKAVALSADGNTALIGAPGDNLGAVWVFRRINNKWVQQSGNLKNKDGIAGKYGYQFGQALALSADGFTAIIGGPDENNVNGAAWIFIDSAYALPVTITSFNAQNTGKGVQVEWAGYNEINLSGYDIERCADGINFIKIGSMPAKNIVSVQSGYVWLDESPLAGNNFYRLKAVNKNAVAQYSRIVKVSMNNVIASIQASPNPVNAKMLRLQVNNLPADIYNIDIYSMSSQKVFTQSITHAGGNAILTKKLQALSAGVYKVVLSNNKYAYQTTIVVQ